MTKFSIITSTLNASKYIDKCIASVHKQTYRNYEHLIVDGDSIDNTVEIINNFKSDKLKIVCSEKDNGIYHAWNKALMFSRGDWIITLGSDDYFISEYDLQYVADFIEEQNILNDVNFIYAETSDNNEMKLIKKKFLFTIPIILSVLFFFKNIVLDN